MAPSGPEFFIKVEWNPDIHMLSGNGDDQEDITVKIWAKLDNRFLELWIFEVLVNPYYGHLQVGNSARICDVTVDNSPLVMYREFHFFLIFIKNNISSGIHFWKNEDYCPPNSL